MYLFAAAAAKAQTDAPAIQINASVIFEKNVEIPMDDGAYLMANIFRPVKEGQYPVILFMSAYGKDLATKDMHAEAWQDMVERVPGLLNNSSGKYHTWETYDPEVWVPYGYILVRIDSRGAGKSPGVLDPFSPREIKDYANAIEWAGVQPWSNGKVGMAGISYYAIIQWPVASLQPPHLAAFIPWEGAADAYRDSGRQGGILSNVFASLWWARQIAPVQHGNGSSPYRDLDDGSPIGGPVSMTPEQLAANRVHILKSAISHPLDDDSYRARSGDFAKITVPFLSGANWGGLGLHARGNFEGFMGAASRRKWIEVHGGNHYIPFFSREGRFLQKHFFDFYLKGRHNSWDRHPPVMLHVRHTDGTLIYRGEREWPLARTVWTKLYLDTARRTLSLNAGTIKTSVTYGALESGMIFKTPPAEREMELTGPLMANLWVSSSTEDMDLFLTLQLFRPDGTEVTFEGASEPAVPLSQGWLRVSQRKLDTVRSKPWRPYHAHDETQKLVPGQRYEVQVELWPTSIVIPEGYTLALRIEGKDFSRSDKGGILTGSGPFLHTHPEDRPPSIFGAKNTVYGGSSFDSYLMIPVIPSPVDTD